jgi:dTDP-4-amino-4,6-dideoxygalactose transaminase
VFADIDADTWNLDAADALKRVTPRTKAIVVAHQVGLAADLDRFEPLAARNIAIIEDAACAIGSTYRGRPIGSHGHLTCFSFHPRKTISLGEGGLIATDDPALAERARQLRSHSASVSDRARHEAKGLVYEEYRELGYNYRMTDLQAAIGLEQLTKLDRLLARRRAIAERYNDAFAALPQIQIPARPTYAAHAYQSYAIRLLPECPVDRDEMMRELVDSGVSCRRGIPPAHLEPLYAARVGRLSLPVTEEVAARSIFLPIFAGLTEGDQARVVEAVTRILTR